LPCAIAMPIPHPARLRRPIPSGSVLTATSISKRFGGIAALREVDFDLRAGEIHALMGENGAGKSTLMKILSGVYTDYDGTVSVDGTVRHFAGVRDAESGGHCHHPSGTQSCSRAQHCRQHSSSAASGSSPDSSSIARQARPKAAALLERLGIELDPTARIGALRVGEQQLVEIAKALSMEARILIMDERPRRLRRSNPSACSRSSASSRRMASPSSTFFAPDR